MPRRTAAHYLPARPPQDQRHHYVFLRDGKPIGLVEAGWTGVNSEDDAWSNMYETVPEYRAAVADGITCRHMDHATYERDIYPLWTAAR